MRFVDVLKAYCNLRNETERNETKICNLRHRNMLVICRIEISILQTLAYFLFANSGFSFRFANYSEPF